MDLIWPINSLGIFNDLKALFWRKKSISKNPDSRLKNQSEGAEYIDFYK